MALSNYEESSTPERLSGNVTRLGSRWGMSTLGMVLFGLPFLGAGAGVMLVGIKKIEVDPATVHAPYWVLTIFGAVFFLAGLLMWVIAWRQFIENRRRAKALALHLTEPALLDRNWDVRGFTPSRWTKVFGHLAGLAGLALFLSIFNWWAFLADGPWLVKVIVGVFDLVLVAGLVQVAMLIGRTLKFGPSGVDYVRFPYRVGESVVVRWLVPARVNQVNGGKITLRCVEEWHETRGRGKNHSTVFIQEVKWRGTWHVEPLSELPVGKLVELGFATPPDALSTCFDTDRPVFWELKIELNLPGLDFVETYVLPVY